jgi:[protein-PII] uridylyltransferase
VDDIAGTRGFAQRRAAVLARPNLTGHAFTAALAAEADEWLRGIFDAAVGPHPVDVALLAVGGYGRGELAPGSDVDLVIVHRNRKDIRQVADAVWYPIWDDRVSLDHSVRSLREMGGAMDDDIKVALGLLDVRTVAGSDALGGEVRRAALDKWVGRAKRWLPQVGDTVDERHDTAGDLAFLLEPDLKEARGGLRDLHLLTALAQVTPILADLVAEGRLDQPAEALVAARVELQRSTGKASNQLLLQDQDTVASRLGMNADQLAARLADAGRAVSWASDDAWRRIRTVPRKQLGRRAWAPRPLEPGLALRNDEVTLLPGADLAADPTLALRAGAVSAELNVPMARNTIDRLVESAPAPEGTWPSDLLQALLRLLGAGRPAVAAFETLDQQGVIERLLPEWGAVRNRPQRNAYHRFTVDRHLLETVANATELVRRVGRPDLLLLAALFHDIGKGFPGDHTDAGIVVLADLGPRLGLPPADVAVLTTLLRCHLLLSEVATRRDLDDPATIAGVAEAVGDRETLALLTALTESDSLATGPAAWGPWKAGLVARLVELVGHSLDGLPAPAPPQPTAEQLALLHAGTLAVKADGDELTVVAPDRPGLLATLAGVLALDGASVRSAAIVATTGGGAPAHSAEDAGPASSFGGPSLPASPAGAVLLVVDVRPTWDVLPKAEQVEADLAAALDRRLSLAAELARSESPKPWRRRSAAKRAVHPDEPRVAVTIDNEASQSATLLEVRAPDARGTLWRIARTIDEAGLSITSAIANTLGAEVVDTFYVQTAGGAKLPDTSAVQDRLRGALIAALTPG